MRKTCNWTDIKQDVRPDGDIAVHLHLFYEDLKEEFFQYLDNIPYEFDLYISCKDTIDTKALTLFFQRLNRVKTVLVRHTQNRGRDIAPLYVLFRDEILAHKYFLHIHSKKSLYSGSERTSWRQMSLQVVLGSGETIQRIFHLFNEQNAGLVFPDSFEFNFPIINDWLANKQQGLELLHKFGIEYDEGSYFTYPAGSFFWARTEALRPVFDMQLSYESFPEEAGQTDGTLAHALECVIAFVSRKQGFDNFILDPTTNILSYNYSDCSLKHLYYNTKQSTLDYLDKFKYISFDIFDTLITRRIFVPDDIFMWLEQLTRIKGYMVARKKAEEEAGKSLGFAVTIKDIYEKMLLFANITRQQSVQLMQLEVDKELQLCIARQDMLDIVRELHKRGKKLILVSDMYFTRDIIEKMLTHCGYDTSMFSDIYVSCECNARKDVGNIWKLVGNKYPILSINEFIHLGDNLRSDMQMVGDLGAMTFYVPSALSMFKASEMYEALKDFCAKRSLADSMLLGMIVNEGLFNSPFALHQGGHISPDAFNTGFSFVGPVLSAFAHYLINNCKDNHLLFLAREGKILQSIYQTVCNNLQLAQNKNDYFLCSRRAIGVASIYNKQDIYKIIFDNHGVYHGRANKLFEVRLGFTIPEDIYIDLPSDSSIATQLCDKYAERIIEQARIERENYTIYLAKVFNSEDNFATVDLGYSGSMQYYLANLMKRKVDGLYLCCTEHPKPLTLGCDCNSLYPFVNSLRNTTFLNYSLMFESMLKIDQGQFKCFDLKDGQLVPQYCAKDEVSVEEKHLQQGFNDFVDKFSRLLYSLDFCINKDLVEQLFLTLVQPQYCVDAQALNKMFVEDNYTNDVPYWQYDGYTLSWKRVPFATLSNLTIVLPFANDSERLTQILQSLTDSNLQDYQLILIDCDSTDGSLDIAKKFGSQCERIHIIKSSSNNAYHDGLNCANGKYVYFADIASFDILLAERINYALSNQDIDLMVLKCGACDNEHKDVVQKEDNVSCYLTNNAVDAVKNIQRLSNMVFSRRFLYDNNLSPINETQYGVQLFALQVCKLAHKVLYAHSIYVKYAVNQQNTICNENEVCSAIEMYSQLLSALDNANSQLRLAYFECVVKELFDKYNTLKGNKDNATKCLVEFLQKAQLNGLIIDNNAVNEYQQYSKLLSSQTDNSITTIIIAQNSQYTIEQCLSSAMAQQGNINHKIIVLDTGSTDDTVQIVNKLISANVNNVRLVKCDKQTSWLSAVANIMPDIDSQYCAFLMAEDYWIASDKLNVDIAQLNANLDSSMTLSRSYDSQIYYNEILPENEYGINKLSVKNLVYQDWQNDICWSSIVVRSKYLKNLPSVLIKWQYNTLPLMYYLTNFGTLIYINRGMTVIRKTHGKNQLIASQFDSEGTFTKLQSSTILAVLDSQYYGYMLAKLISSNYFADACQDEQLVQYLHSVDNLQKLNNQSQAVVIDQTHKGVSMPKKIEQTTKNSEQLPKTHHKEKKDTIENINDTIGMQSYNEQLQFLISRLSNSEAQTQNAVTNYNNISSSFYWKLTKPIRFVAKGLRKIPIFKQIYILLRSLKNNGVKGTLSKIKKRLKGENKLPTFAQYPVPLSLVDMAEQIINNGGIVYNQHLLNSMDIYSKKKCLLVSHELHLTGAPVALAYMAQSLKRLGYLPIIVSPADGAMSGQLAKDGFVVMICGQTYSSNLIANSAKFFDCVVVNTIIGAPIVTQLNGTKIPVLWWIHEARASYENGVKQMPKKLESNIHVYCVGNYAQKMLKQYHPKYKSEQLLYFVPDYTKTKFKQINCLDTYKYKRVYALIGTQEWRKGQDILVKAIRKLPRRQLKESLFVFVGKQYYYPIKQKIDKLVKDYPHNVKSIEQVSREDMPSFFKQIDCLVCPSRDDPMPIVVTEAMLLGKTVICAKGVGSASIIAQHQAGIVYRNNARNLVKCLKKVFNADRQQLNKMVIGARQAYEQHFAQDVFDANIAEIINKIQQDNVYLQDYEGKVSVVIPTYNAGKNFDKLIKLLHAQEKIAQVEVVVVDSGSTDGTYECARKNGAKVIRIDKSEFSHSYARNLGAKHSSGNYVLFMTQDAFPNGHLWIRQLLNPVLTQKSVVAVSCREAPRPDSDLYAKVGIWNYSQYIDMLNNDRILSKPTKDDFDSIRKNSQLNDVTCLIDKEIFLNYCYRGDYAEDLDLGIRLVNDGYRLALLSSVQVVHSHTRPAYYHLRRGIVDITTLKKILPSMYCERIFEDTVPKRIITAHCTLNLLMQYAQNLYCNALTWDFFYTWLERDMYRFENLLKGKSQEFLQSIIELDYKGKDKDVCQFVLQLFNRYGKEFVIDESTNRSLLCYMQYALLRYVREYNLPPTKENIMQVLHALSLFEGQLFGEALSLYAIANPQEESYLKELIDKLSAGI